MVYTVVAAALLAVLFDLSRIASLGAILYLFMDMIVQWGVFSRLRREVGASGTVILTAIGLDAIALGALLVIKFDADPLILWVALGGIVLVFGAERLFLQQRRQASQ